MIMIEGALMILQGLVMVLTLGLYHPDWWGKFIEWKLKRMFRNLKA